MESNSAINSISSKTKISQEKFSDRDITYMDAVYRGDMETAQRLVDEKAKKAGYSEKLYHQTGNNFFEFDTRHKGAGTRDNETPFGIFMKKTDADIGIKGQKQMPLFAKINNPLKVNNSSIDYSVITSDEGQTAYAKAVAEALIEFCNLSEKEAPSIPQTTKTIYDIAQEVIKGCYGNGTERKKKLEAMGYSYSAVQSLVNQILKGKKPIVTPSPQPLKKSNLEIAGEVIQGKWDNGTTRKQKLNGAGYDYSTIQKLVNQLCK